MRLKLLICSFLLITSVIAAEETKNATFISYDVQDTFVVSFVLPPGENGTHLTFAGPLLPEHPDAAWMHNTIIGIMEPGINGSAIIRITHVSEPYEYSFSEQKESNENFLEDFVREAISKNQVYEVQRSYLIDGIIGVLAYRSNETENYAVTSFWHDSCTSVDVISYYDPVATETFFESFHIIG